MRKKYKCAIGVHVFESLDLEIHRNAGHNARFHATYSEKYKENDKASLFVPSLHNGTALN